MKYLAKVLWGEFSEIHTMDWSQSQTKSRHFRCTNCQITFSSKRGISLRAQSCGVKSTSQPDENKGMVVMDTTTEMRPRFKLGNFDGAIFTKKWKMLMMLIMLISCLEGEACFYFKQKMLARTILTKWRVLTAESMGIPSKIQHLNYLIIKLSLLLQEPLKSSKAKDHLKVLKKRLELWKQGNVNKLLHEAVSIQKTLKTISYELLNKYQKSFQALCIKETWMLPSNYLWTTCRIVSFQSIKISWIYWFRKTKKSERWTSTSKHSSYGHFLQLRR